MMISCGSPGCSITLPPSLDWVIRRDWHRCSSTGQAILVAKNHVKWLRCEMQACQNRPIGMNPNTSVPSVQNQLS